MLTHISDLREMTKGAGHMSINYKLLLGSILAASVWLGACEEDEDDDHQDETASVTISGQHSVELGKTLSLSASTTNGIDTGYSWASKDETVAKVDSAGKVTAVASGETEISATGDDTKALRSHAVVVLPLGAVSITISGGYSVKVGGTLKLSATTQNATDSGYTWSVDKAELASVATDGTLSGLAPGTVVVTATGAQTKVSGSIGLVVGAEIPNYDSWLGSAHADVKAEAFNHWNADTPAEIPTGCARCHSTPGFQDYLGADGSAAGKVDKAAKVGTVIECQACHNTAASALASVTFPSGVTIDKLGAEARCMTCHQGAASSDDVDQAIKDAAPTDDDTVSSKLSFINIHYYAAGATLNAGRVRGGYQYATKVYDWRFRHVPTHDTCVDCHDAHSLKVKISECKTCHTGVTSEADLKKIRMIASLGSDYDGDGDKTEGIADELAGLQALLLQAIQAYAGEQKQDKICYDKATYPYFFIDADGDGACSSAEAAFTSRYVKWTSRLLRAAYNYQVASKDPGAFAHNVKYIIQLLYDGVEDLNTKLTTKVDLTKAVRNDPGHFNGAGEPARHWDEDDVVSSSCSKCHGGSEGYSFFQTYGVGKSVEEQDNGLDCATCHKTFGTSFDLVTVDSVTYPSGKTITDVGNPSNVCATCHSGREAKATIDAKIAANSLGFRNVHYLPAAAIKAGSKAAVGYEYGGKTYAGEWTKHSIGHTCTYCHDPKVSNHTFDVADVISSKCTGCHTGVTKPSEIRFTHTLDYDGDGNTTEPLADEISTLAAALLAQIKVEAAKGSVKICYSSTVYPYFLTDTDGNGTCDSGEATAYPTASWTAALMKATHNYQISQKEPGAWAHNFDYLAQLLIDSIEDLGGAVTAYKRP